MCGSACARRAIYVRVRTPMRAQLQGVGARDVGTKISLGAVVVDSDRRRRGRCPSRGTKFSTGTAVRYGSTVRYGSMAGRGIV
eukprot:SAG31_NODE_495_length_14864_cov_21.943109_2_plen_83_part_00